MGLSGAVSTHGDIDFANGADKDEEKMVLAGSDNSGRLQAALFSNTPTNTINLFLHFALWYYLTLDVRVYTFNAFDMQLRNHSIQATGNRSKVKTIKNERRERHI